jgi:tetratricopeptide (TPR) repeat protein
LTGDSHRHPNDHLATCRFLAHVRSELGRFNAAAGVLERALPAAQRGVLDRNELADLLAQLGNVDRLRGHYVHAETRLRQALAGAELPPFNAAILATTHNGLGILLKDTARYVEAGMHYSIALDYARDPRMRAAVLHNIAGLAHAQGHFAQAEEPARAAVELRSGTCGTFHPDVAADIAVLGAVLYGQHRFAEAEVLFNQALITYETRYGPDHFEVAVNLGNLAALYADTGRAESAEQHYRRALTIKHAILGENHADVARLLNNLATLYQTTGRPSEAHTAYRRALAIFTGTLGPNHPATRACTRNFERLMRESEPQRSDLVGFATPICIRRA